jgi:hypothetical protein
LFSGCCLGQNGGAVLHMCQIDQKVDVAVQARGRNEAGNMGDDAGKKKRKTISLGVAPSFRIFGV